MDITFLTVMLSVAFALIVSFLYRVFRFLQRNFYALYEKITGKDIRSKRYKAYLIKKQEKIERRQQRHTAMLDSTSPYYDSDYSSSSDSYSGGGGESGGGGSDRSF